MAKKNKNNLTIILLVIVIGGVSGGIVYGIYNSSQSESTFSIPVPEELSFIVDDITCRFRVTAYVIDSTGSTATVTSGNSQFGNPSVISLDVVDVKSGKNTSGYVAIPKAGCDAKAGVVIDKSNFWVTWEALDSNGNWKKIKTTSFTSNKVSIPANFGIGVKPLGSTSISTTVFDNEVEDVLGSGNLQSSFRIQTFGIMVIHWEGYEAIKYYYQVDKEKSTISGLAFKIVHSSEVDDEDTRDGDNDGIIDSFDMCKTKKETYNGYKDSDGCPDTLPDESVIDEDTGDETPPEDNTNNEDEPNPIDSDEECQEYADSQGDVGVYVWDEENQVCGVVDDTNNNNAGSSLIKNAYILVEPQYKDGTRQAFTLPLEGQAPLDIEFQAQNILGSFDGINQKAIVDIETSVYIDVGTTSWKVKSHTVTAKPSFRVSGTDVILDEILYAGYSTSNANTVSLPKTVSGGQVTFTGLSLGKASFRTSEIEINIPSGLVTDGQIRDLDTRIDITGDITLETNSGGVLVGTLDDGLLTWSMKVAKPTSAQQQNCKEGENAVTVEGSIICIPYGEDPPSNNQCTLGQGSCEICTDNGSGIGGFPCTLEYRDAYCDSTNQCEVPPNSDTDNPNGQKIDPECKIGEICILTSTDPETGQPENIAGGFPSYQQGGNPFAGIGADLNNTALLLGVFGIIAGIVIIIYKKTRK